MVSHDYDESQIRSLDWREHIRCRPGMYIGKTGDGSASDDGIYILLKEIFYITQMKIIIAVIK